jgi:hypothetical protein
VRRTAGGARLAAAGPGGGARVDGDTVIVPLQRDGQGGTHRVEITLGGSDAGLLTVRGSSRASE